MAYHFHGKAADIPLAVTELIFTPEGYAGFEYYVLQEGDLLIGYFSDQGAAEMRTYAAKRFSGPDEQRQLCEQIREYDKKLTAFMPSQAFAPSVQASAEERRAAFREAKELMREFGENYFNMEQPWLLGPEEIIARACEREGYAHDEVLAHPERAVRFSTGEQALLATLIELGHLKLDVHTHSEPVMHVFYDVYRHIADTAGIPVAHAEVFTVAEIEQYLETGALPADDLALRAEGVVFIPGREGAAPRMGSHVEYLEWKALLEPPVSGDIRGAVACRGRVRGRVSVHLGWIRTTEIPPGNILVTGMTNPQMVPYIKHAGAIVTDEGGLACHAAIISREMGIPCIVGTKVATRALQDGDLVEVDAEQGVVRILERK